MFHNWRKLGPKQLFPFSFLFILGDENQLCSSLCLTSQMVLAQKKKKGGKQKGKNHMWKGALVIGQGTIATMAIVAIALMSDRQNYVGQKANHSHIVEKLCYILT